MSYILRTYRRRARLRVGRLNVTLKPQDGTWIVHYSLAIQLLHCKSTAGEVLFLRLKFVPNDSGRFTIFQNFNIGIHVRPLLIVCGTVTVV
jgi:hypothetical protein